MVIFVSQKKGTPYYTYYIPTPRGTKTKRDLTNPGFPCKYVAKECDVTGFNWRRILHLGVRTFIHKQEIPNMENREISTLSFPSLHFAFLGQPV